MHYTGKIKPSKYFIEDNKDGLDLYLIENIKENEDLSYDYDKYHIKIYYRDNYKDYIEKNYISLLEKAKQEEYKYLSKKIREKRNLLLNESDFEMTLDRIGLEVPEGTTFTAWKPFLKTLGDRLSGDWAKYRQALRDITNQEGFPYNVKFPEKPC